MRNSRFYRWQTRCTRRCTHTEGRHIVAMNLISIWWKMNTLNWLFFLSVVSPHCSACTCAQMLFVLYVHSFFCTQDLSPFFLMNLLNEWQLFCLFLFLFFKMYQGRDRDREGHAVCSSMTYNLFWRLLSLSIRKEAPYICHKIYLCYPRAHGARAGCRPDQVPLS